MERTKLQQIELDKIEKSILIALFGKTEIPESTAVIMRCYNINPNQYIKKLEDTLIPLMKDNGEINGGTAKKMIRLLKPNIVDVLNIPDEDFKLSEKVSYYFSLFFPGFEVY